MAFLQRNNADDLLFPSDESGQTRYNKMRVLMFSGANASLRMAEFIKSYTNRDGSLGIPMTHIGATSPYIDSGNLFYIYFQDNANDPFVEAMFGVPDNQGNFTNEIVNKTAALNQARLGYVNANTTLIARLQGSDQGWKN